MRPYRLQRLIQDPCSLLGVLIIVLLKTAVATTPDAVIPSFTVRTEYFTSSQTATQDVHPFSTSLAPAQSLPVSSERFKQYISSREQDTHVSIQVTTISNAAVPSTTSEHEIPIEVTSSYAHAQSQQLLESTLELTQQNLQISASEHETVETITVTRRISFNPANATLSGDDTLSAFLSYQPSATMTHTGQSSSPALLLPSNSEDFVPTQESEGRIGSSIQNHPAPESSSVHPFSSTAVISSVEIAQSTHSIRPTFSQSSQDLVESSDGIITSIQPSHSQPVHGLKDSTDDMIASINPSVSLPSYHIDDSTGDIITPTYFFRTAYSRVQTEIVPDQNGTRDASIIYTDSSSILISETEMTSRTSEATDSTTDTLSVPDLMSSSNPTVPQMNTEQDFIVTSLDSQGTFEYDSPVSLSTSALDDFSQHSMSSTPVVMSLSEIPSTQGWSNSMDSSEIIFSTSQGTFSEAGGASIISSQTLSDVLEGIGFMSSSQINAIDPMNSLYSTPTNSSLATTDPSPMYSFQSLSRPATVSHDFVNSYDEIDGSSDFQTMLSSSPSYSNVATASETETVISPSSTASLYPILFPSDVIQYSSVISEAPSFADSASRLYTQTEADSSATILASGSLTLDSHSTLVTTLDSSDDEVATLDFELSTLLPVLYSASGTTSDSTNHQAVTSDIEPSSALLISHSSDLESVTSDIEMKSLPLTSHSASVTPLDSSYYQAVTSESELTSLSLTSHSSSITPLDSSHHQAVTSVSELFTSSLTPHSAPVTPFDPSYHQVVTSANDLSTPVALSSTMSSEIFTPSGLPSAPVTTEPSPLNLKEVYIEFDLEGDCTLIENNQNSINQLHNALVHVLEILVNQTIRPNNGNFTNLECHPFHVVMRLDQRLAKILEMINTTSEFQKDLMNVTFITRDNKTARFKIVNIQTIDFQRTRAQGSYSIVDTIIINIAACICGIIVALGILAFLREMCYKNRFKGLNFNVSRYGIRKIARVSLTGLPRSCSVNSEMKDNGSLSGLVNPPPDGVYSTIGYETETTTTSFMNKSDLRRSSGKTGKGRRSLTRKAKSNMNGNGGWQKGQPNGTMQNHKPYGFVVGLMGYKSENNENHYAVPNKPRKKTRVYGLAIRSTGSPTRAPSNNTKPSGDTPIVPPRRHSKRYLKKGEVTDSSENLVSRQKKNKNGSDAEGGVVNPSFVVDSSVGVYDSKSSLHI